MTTARQDRGEGGFTIVELTIVSAVMLVVTVSLFQMLDNLTRNERTQQAMVTNQERVRFGMVEIGRELRAANPLNSLTAAADYPTSVELSLGPKQGIQTHVRWRLVGTDLIRETLSAPNGTVTASRVRLTNVRNTANGITLFRYFYKDGTEIDVLNNAADVQACAIRVRVALMSDVDEGLPFTEASDFEMRNTLPGNLNC